MRAGRTTRARSRCGYRCSCGAPRGNPEQRAPRPRIAIDLELTRMNRLADALELRPRMRRQLGQTRIHRILLRMALDEALHDAVFERMKADHAQSAARGERRERAGERCFDL